MLDYVKVIVGHSKTFLHCVANHSTSVLWKSEDCPGLTDMRRNPWWSMFGVPASKWIILILYTSKNVVKGYETTEQIEEHAGLAPCWLV